MSRRRFLGTAAAGLGAAALGLSGAAKAELPPQIETIVSTDYGFDVYPTNGQILPSPPFPWDSNTDLYSIQWAVLIGALGRYMEYGLPTTVRLKHLPGTPFNLDGYNLIADGFPGIMIPFPVTIEGDGLNADGTPKTIVNGGGGSIGMPAAAFTIFFGGDPELPVVEGPVKIDGLWLDGQTLGGIAGFSFFGVEITNNRLTNISAAESSLMGTDGYYRFGIVFSRAFQDPWPGDPQDVIIRGNYLENTSKDIQVYENPDPPPKWLPLWVDLGVASVGMSDNIEMRDNFSSNKGLPFELNCNEGPSNIIDGNTAITQVHDYQDAGIWAMCHEKGNTWITNNDITILEGSNGCGFMISNPEDAQNPNDIYEVSGNRLRMGSGFAAFHMGEPGFCFIASGAPLNGALIKNNIVEGTAGVGFLCLDYPDFWDDGQPMPFQNTSHGNLVLGNNMSKFHPTTVDPAELWLGADLWLEPGQPLILENLHVYLGPNAYDNDFRGNFGQYIWDRNGGNSITGFGPMKGAGGAGPQISGYALAKADLKKQATGAMLEAMANAAKAVAHGLAKR